MEHVYRDASAATKEREELARAQVDELESSIGWLVWAVADSKLRKRAQRLRERLDALPADRMDHILARTEALAQQHTALEQIAAFRPSAEAVLEQYPDDAPPVHPFHHGWTFPISYALDEVGLLSDAAGSLREIARHDPKHTMHMGSDSVARLRFRAWGVPFFLALLKHFDVTYQSNEVCYTLATRVPDAIPSATVRPRGVLDRALDAVGRSRGRTGDTEFDRAFVVICPRWSLPFLAAGFRRAMGQLAVEKAVRLDLNRGTARLQWAAESDVVGLRVAIDALRHLREATHTVRLGPIVAG